MGGKICEVSQFQGKFSTVILKNRINMIQSTSIKIFFKRQLVNICLRVLNMVPFFGYQCQIFFIFKSILGKPNVPQLYL